MNDIKKPSAIGLIADSSCDLTPKLKERTHACIVPLNIIVDGKNQYCDDGTVDLALLFKDMKQSKKAAQSSCPSIGTYMEAMKRFDACFVVTLSSKISGSYQSAYNAAQMVMEDFPHKKIHVFDSKSASAGETTLLLFLDTLIKNGRTFEESILLTNEYIKRSKTLFVLKDLGNLIRNGRMRKVPGMIASALSIFPILGDDGDGKIRLFKKERGIKRALSSMVDMVKEMTKNKKSTLLVLGHCNCKEQAQWLREEILKRCLTLKEVLIVSMGALSSMYAGEEGIVVSFASNV